MKVQETKTKHIGSPENIKPYVVVGVGVLVVAVTVYQLISNAPGNLLQSRLDKNATQEAAHPGSTKEDQQSLVVKNIDSDSDGLTDTEEERIYHTDPLKPDSDGDTYKDGDEVKTGHDPKVNESGQQSPGASALTSASSSQKYNRFIASSPDDLSNIDPTKYLNQEEMKGIASGNPSEQNIEKIATLALSNAAISQKEALPTIPDSAIKITEASGKLAVQQYFMSMASTMLQFAPFSDPTQMTDYIEDIAGGDVAKAKNLLSMAKTSEAQLKTIPVPREMVDIHKEVIGVMQVFQQSGNVLLNADTVAPSDGIAAANQLRIVTNATNDLANTMMGILKKYGINTL